MSKSQKGFEELEHTADWALRIWGKNLGDLIWSAINGMYSLSGITFEDEVVRIEEVKVESEDEEALLVNVLTEVLYWGEMDRLAVKEMEINQERDATTCRFICSRILTQENEIKAVTYHGLKIKRKNGGMEAEVVFDV